MEYTVVRKQQRGSWAFIFPMRFCLPRVFPPVSIIVLVALFVCVAVFESDGLTCFCISFALALDLHLLHHTEVLNGQMSESFACSALLTSPTSLPIDELIP
jgi:hypothetical protein